MLKETTLGALEKKLSVFLSELAERLFYLSSDSAFPKALRPKAFEAYAIVKAQHRALKSDLLQQVDTGFEHLITCPSTSPADAGLGQESSELDLVDLDSFNDDLAINRIAQQALDHHWQAVEAITLRVANLLGVAPKTITLPTDPLELTNAYRDCMKRIELSTRIMLELDKVFLSEFLIKLDDLYEGQNSLLRAEGLLPNIEDLIEEQGSQLGAAKQQTSDHSPQLHTSQHRDLTEEQRKPTDNVTENSHRESGLRSSYGSGGSHLEGPFLSDMGATAAGSETAYPSSDDPPRSEQNHQSLAEHGNYLPGRQRQLGKRGALFEENRTSVLEDSTSSEVFNADLEQKAVELSSHIFDLRKNGVTADRALNSVVKQLKLDQLGAEMAPITRSVELIDDLYSTIEQHLPLSEILADSMNTVRLPLAQLSINDPTFYRDPEHPARLFVERVGEIMRLAPENHSRIAGEIDQIAERLNQNFEQDPEAFDQAFHETTDLAVRLLRQQQVAIDRLIAAEEGKEKRMLARQQVCDHMERALHQRPLPEPYIQLLESTALDALTILLLQQDTDGYEESLKQLLLGADQLTQPDCQSTPKSPAEAESSLEALRDTLKLPEILLPEQETVFENLFLALQREGTEVQSREYKAPVSKYAEPEFGQRLTQLPRLRRWTQRARNLVIGNWISDAPGGKGKHHVQLIWKNNEATRFVFINEKAQKYREFSLVGLARWLATRLNPVEPVDQLSIVDKSLFIALEKKQAELFQPESRSGNALLSTEDVVDATQIQIRNARRHDRVTHCGIVVPKRSLNMLERTTSALENLGQSTCLKGLVDEHFIGMLIELDRGTLLATLEQVLDSDEIDRVVIRPIDSSQSNAEKFWRGMLVAANNCDDLVTVQHGSSGNDSPGIKRSVEHTLKRLEEDSPPRIGYRQIILTNPHLPSSTDVRFQVLLDGSPTIETVALKLSGNDSTALLIALDCLKIKSVCHVATRLMDANLAVPRFQINLCTAATLHHQFLDFLLTVISESGIGTDRLLFELRDSVRLRESAISRDFSQAMRSIGCLIGVSNITLSRGSTAELQALHPHNLVLDRELLEKNVHEDQLSTMQQTITELHHMINENVAIRGDIGIHEAEQLGVDVVESIENRTLSPEQLVASQPQIVR